MKIITDNAAYVQINDITFLNHCDLPIPASVFMKSFGFGIFVVDDSNRYDFKEFNKPEDIEFFKNIDWMIDYNEVKDLSDEEHIALAQSIADEMNAIAEKFNSMSPKQKKKNINMISQLELLEFKFDSLRDVYWFKHDDLKMNLPEGVEYPAGFKQENGAKKLIRKIFNKNND